MLHCGLETGMLQLLNDRFPSVYVSSPTLRILRRKQSQQLHPQPSSSLPTAVSQKVEQMLQKYKALQRLARKNLRHATYMQQFKLQRAQERAVKKTVHSTRVAASHARKCYLDYESALRRKLQVPRTKEEQTFVRTFQDGLRLKKERERERLKYTKERCGLLERKLCDHLDSVETWYPFVMGVVFFVYTSYRYSLLQVVQCLN